MQLKVSHKIQNELVLPLNYHHILQAIIYKSLGKSYGYNNFVHDTGFQFDNRKFKMFTFSLLKGKYRIENRKIYFQQEVSFEVRSPEIFFIRQLAEHIEKYGISYGEQHYNDIEIELSEDTIEWEEVHIKMKTPITVYSTDPFSKNTYFFQPDEEEFYQQICDNFVRKYIACFGVEPEEGIWIEPVRVSDKDKFVTNYKGFYISGWYGEYYLTGRRKYLDFLYQTGLGSKNSQGFGMFDIV